MKILLGVPRWRSAMQCAEDFQFGVMAEAAARKIPLARIPADAMSGWFVPVARENLCAYARDQGFDVVLMADADTQLVTPGEALDMAARCIEQDFAILGAPMRSRGVWTFTFSSTLSLDGEADPDPTPEQMRTMLDALKARACWATDGHVGTTICAVNVKHLRAVPRPWFLAEPDARDRATEIDWTQGVVTTTDDVHFCRRVHRAGLKVGVDFGVRSGRHWTGQALDSEPMLGQLERDLEEKYGAGLILPGGAGR